MNKTSAIFMCLRLLSKGIYAIPRYDIGYHDWVVVILHDFTMCMFYDETELARFFEDNHLHFVDCYFNIHDYQVNSFPYYFLKP